MPRFGLVSQQNLSTCHPDIQRVLNEAIKYVNFSVTCGHRGKQAQDKAFAEGKSKVQWPNGEHNKVPAMAVDVAPYPCDWNDLEGFTYLAGIIVGIACTMGIDLTSGVDWNSNLNTREHSFLDRPHLELNRGR